MKKLYVIVEYDLRDGGYLSYAVDEIVFENETELINFVTSYDTNFYKFLAGMFNWSLRIYYNGFPWMGDAINPRTGKKGYESEWTDDDLVLYFNITPEEYNIINKTIEKYENN